MAENAFAADGSDLLGEGVIVILIHDDNGQTILLITHDQPVADAATRLVRMRDGRIVDDGLGGATAGVATTAGIAAVSPAAEQASA